MTNLCELMGKKEDKKGCNVLVWVLAIIGAVAAIAAIAYAVYRYMTPDYLEDFEDEFDEEDELLGTKYVNDFNKYFNKYYMINAGGHKIYKDTAKILFEVVIPDHLYGVKQFSNDLKEVDNAPWLN